MLLLIVPSELHFNWRTAIALRFADSIQITPLSGPAKVFVCAQIRNPHFVSRETPLNTTGNDSFRLANSMLDGTSIDTDIDQVRGDAGVLRPVQTLGTISASQADIQTVDHWTT